MSAFQYLPCFNRYLPRGAAHAKTGLPAPGSPRPQAALGRRTGGEPPAHAPTACPFDYSTVARIAQWANFFSSTLAHPCAPVAELDEQLRGSGVECVAKARSADRKSGAPCAEMREVNFEDIVILSRHPEAQNADNLSCSPSCLPIQTHAQQKACSIDRPCRFYTEISCCGQRNHRQ